MHGHQSRCPASSLGLGPGGVGAADVEEGLLGQVVEVAVDQLLERLDRLVDRDVMTPGRPVKTSATNIGWDRNRCILRARSTVTRSSSDSSSRPRMAMMSCSSL